MIIDIGGLSRFVDLDHWEVITDKRGNRAGAEKKRLLNVVCAFDIETTTLNIAGNPHSFMYIWQFQIGREITVIGRYWWEFNHLLNWFKERLPEGVKVVVYVHNLAYEFHFLQGIFGFNAKSVFAPQSHKVLKADLDPFEFRCNYKRTNMSLGKWLDNLGVETQKTALDYSVVRYPWTVLTPDELEYCINDVKGLVEGVYLELENNKDSLITIPLTVTGYLRRDVKKAMRRYPHAVLQKTLPPYEVYKLLRLAFEGGDTHANRHFANKIIKNVESHDRSSSYPAVMLNEQFPVGAWRISVTRTPETLQELTDTGKAWVTVITLRNIQMHDYYFPDPIIAKAKCWDLEGVREDNGRILTANRLTMAVTDVKWWDICDIYDFEIEAIHKIYYSRYDYLPTPLLRIIQENFKYKTELKGVEGQEYYYFKRKEKNNSAYGMMAQDPVQQAFIYADGEFLQEEQDEEKIYNKAIKKAFLSYAWGVWTTAHARHHLLEGIKNCYEQGYIYYWDTDSCKHSPGITFDTYNNDRIKEDLANGGMATDSKGKEHYLGFYEYEGFYDRFKTKGAKKYVYEEKGKLHITIAGVHKIKGAAELARSGGIEAFEDGFTFYDGGGTESAYNIRCEFKYDTGHGTGIRITDNIALTPSTYTLGLSGEYEKLLHILLHDQNGRKILQPWLADCTKN